MNRFRLHAAPTVEADDVGGDPGPATPWHYVLDVPGVNVAMPGRNAVAVDPRRRFGFTRVDRGHFDFAIAPRA
jgi:hypothetical protein